MLAFIIPQILAIILVFYVQVPSASRKATLETYLLSGLDNEARLPPDAENYTLVAYFFYNNLETNFYVIDSLRILGALDRLDTGARGQIIDWLAFHMAPDGRIKSRYFWESDEFSYPAVDCAYYTLYSLRNLRITVDVSANNITAFLTDSNYEYVDDAYYTVSSLDTLGKLEETNTSEIHSFVTSCQYLEKQNYSEPYATREFMVNYGGFSPEPKGWTSMRSTYYAVSALKILGYANDSNSDAAVEWILKHQTDSEGFCSELSLVWDDETLMPIDTEPTEPDIFSTFYAVESLESLGKLNLIDKNKTVEYIASLQRRTGTFGHGVSDGYAYEDKLKSIYESTYVALSMLESLDATELLNSMFPVPKILLEIFRELPPFFFMSVIAIACLDVFLKLKRII